MINFTPFVNVIGSAEVGARSARNLQLPVDVYLFPDGGVTSMLVMISVTLVNVSFDGATRFVEEMNSFGRQQHARVENLFVARFPERSDVDDVAHTSLSDVSMCFGVSEAAMFQCRITIMVDAGVKTHHSDR